jgi:hypothetical protein
MADTLSRDEITSRLEAAEARTETRIAHLFAGMDARAMVTDHKIDILADRIDAKMDVLASKMDTKMDVLAAKMDAKIDALGARMDARTDAMEAAVSDMKLDGKRTRDLVVTVVVGASIAMLGAFVALWVAGINEQGNLIAGFQAGLAVRAADQAGQVPPKPQTVPSPPAPVAPATPAGK